MPEVDKYVTFNALHICVVALLINLVKNFLFNHNFDYIVNFINYIINIDRIGFWFITIHILLTCLLLWKLKFEVIFYASMKFNL